MAKPRVPRDLLDPVVAYFRPQRVILFGSRARGDAWRDSDIDLLVVVDDDTPAEKLTWQDGYGAYRSKRDADIFPMRANDFERDRAIANTLAAEADADGIVVYGAPKGSCMKAPDPRDRWEAVNRWLALAEVDRNAAKTLLAVPSLHPSVPFHCPQAVEKLLKGFLTLAGKRGGKTHALDRLGAAASKSFPEIEELVTAAKNWSDWVVVYRYPSDAALAVPKENELQRALDVIDELAKRLQRPIPSRAGDARRSLYPALCRRDVLRRGHTRQPRPTDRRAPGRHVRRFYRAPAPGRARVRAGIRPHRRRHRRRASGQRLAARKEGSADPRRLRGVAGAFTPRWCFETHPDGRSSA